jgi:hypothetical protein
MANALSNQAGGFFCFFHQVLSAIAKRICQLEPPLYNEQFRYSRYFTNWSSIRTHSKKTQAKCRKETWYYNEWHLKNSTVLLNAPLYKLEGISRELYSLIGGAPPVAFVKPTFKAKFQTKKKATPW